MEFFGVRLIGFNSETAIKLALTVALLVIVLAARTLLVQLADAGLRRGGGRSLFWVRQTLGIATTAAILLGFLSIWFEDPRLLAGALGLITAGVAFALQKVILAMAGYLLILRADNFTVGDRVRMGSVRGDVIGLSLFQTTILEMGQPESAQADESAQWVKSRQFTGRVVTVSNAVIFDEPVYNYTRDFPYIWEEIAVPVSYRDDRIRAEKILFEAAEPHALRVGELSASDRERLESRHRVDLGDILPRVYWRITDNWLELSVRFLTPAHGVRDVKDAMSRTIMREFDLAGIGIASATHEVVGLPPLELHVASSNGDRLPGVARAASPKSASQGGNSSGT